MASTKPGTTVRTRRDFGRIRKLPSGRFQAYYDDPDGRRAISKTGKDTPVRHTADHTFTTRIDAESWLIDERRLISAGTWTPPAERRAERLAAPEDKLTLGAYAETWLTNRKVKGRPLAPKTVAGYRDVLSRFINPTFEHTPLTDITSAAIDVWYEQIPADTPTYRAHAYGLLRTMLNTAADRNLIATNPAKVRGGGSAPRQHKVKTATLSEVALIVAAMPERRRPMIQLATWCSLRFGELAELRRKDVNLVGEIIEVRRGVVNVKPVPRHLPPGTQPCGCRAGCLIGPPKSDAGVRDVHIPPHLLDDLRRHLSSHVGPSKEALLFPSADGKHLTPSAFYGAQSTFYAAGQKKGQVKRKGHGYYEARRLAGRPELHLHDLRHTGLTNAAVAGATLAELMALAGHTTPTAALRYQHAASDRMRDLARRLSEMAEPKAGVTTAQPERPSNTARRAD